ncbi:hypothetical protein C9374_009255 [Naegleria lovaniensis]|uniref:Uncharacterized protein n=1 Tax=Naegleria lovaniensis TaxID=51637 RepID=A0AA88GH12_NAELO|nr:uncharacterized protein C9374_009255 [Naegleria lovaniensis]KAG2377344.1 hypothetical protein C9374_009255 [Naegleria lovaniensis]
MLRKVSDKFVNNNQVLAANTTRSTCYHLVICNNIFPFKHHCTVGITNSHHHPQIRTFQLSLQSNSPNRHHDENSNSSSHNQWIHEPVWRVVRLDDNGNEYEMERGLTKKQADELAQEFTSRLHKPMYWSELIPELSGESDSSEKRSNAHAKKHFKKSATSFDTNYW